MTPSLLDMAGRALTEVEPIVAAVPREAYGRPTPCAEFDVGTLLGHLIGGLRGFANLAEGGEISFDLDPDLSTEDALVEYTRAADRVREGWGVPGMLDREYTVPWGTSTGTQLTGFVLIEVVQHGWDLARAAGIPYEVSPDLSEAALAGARMWVDEGARVPMLFGPEVPIGDDAPAADRLAAFLGRTV